MCRRGGFVGADVDVGVDVESRQSAVERREARNELKLSEDDDDDQDGHDDNKGLQ